MQFSGLSTLEVTLLSLGTGLVGLVAGHAVSRGVVRLDSDRPPAGLRAGFLAIQNLFGPAENGQLRR